MFGPLLRKTAIFIFFCNIFVETQDLDFLEYYKPKPGLPKELNQWLSDVQQYKGDFRLIRAIAEKQEKDGLDYDTDTLADTNIKLFDNLEEENEYLDEAPKNDIYPHMYKQKKNPYENFGTSFDKPGKNRKYAPKNPRQRRHSDKDSLFDKRDIYINPKSDDGEIKRSDDKYPDRFFNNHRENVNQKREIQIDVLNDGKLVKQIRENDKDPKSIVLNIQSLDKFRNPPPAYKPEPMPTENDANQLRPQDSQLKIFPVQRSAADSETNNREFSNNFKNLFNANENLNTDSSIAREKLGQTALLYRVTLPDPDNLFLPDQDKVTVKEDNQSGYNHNGMKDMSQFWTATEKNQMQKGIEFARGNWNGKPIISTQQSTERSQMQKGLEFARGNWNGKPIISTQQSTDNDGFELVKSVVIDADNMKNNYIRPKKRESQTIEGRVRINADGDNKNIVYNADVKPSKSGFDSYMPMNGNDVNEAKKINPEERNITPNIVLIDSQTGSKIMEGAIESIQTIDEHAYGPNNIESKEEPNLSIPLDGNTLEDNVPPDSSIEDKLNGDIGKIEVMAESNVDELIPEEYRETTTVFLIPAPDGEHNVQNIEDIGVKNYEEEQMMQVDQLGEQQEPEQIDESRLDDNGKVADGPVETNEETVDELNAHKENEDNGEEATELPEENHKEMESNQNHHEIQNEEEGSDARETDENVHEHNLHHNNHEQNPNHHQKHSKDEGTDMEENRGENTHEPQLQIGSINTGETKETYEEPEKHDKGKLHPHQNHLTDESIDSDETKEIVEEPKCHNNGRLHPHQNHLTDESIDSDETKEIVEEPKCHNNGKLHLHQNHLEDDSIDTEGTKEIVEEPKSHNNGKLHLHQNQNHLTDDSIDTEGTKEIVEEPKLHKNGKLHPHQNHLTDESIDTEETKEIVEEPKCHNNGKLHPHQNHLTDESIDTEETKEIVGQPKLHNNGKLHPHQNHLTDESTDTEEAKEIVEEPKLHNNGKLHPHQNHLTDESIDTEEAKEIVEEPKLHNNGKLHPHQNHLTDESIDTEETKEIVVEPKLHNNGKLHPHQNHLTDGSIDTEGTMENKNESKVIHLENEGIGNAKIPKPQEEHQHNECIGIEEHLNELDHHHGHKEKQNQHPANTFPLTRIHKVDQHIHDHLMVTSIETITVLDQNQINEGERPEGKEQENGEEPKVLPEAESQENVPEVVQKPHAKDCFDNTNKHHKTVKIFTKPLNKHHKKEREKFSLNRAQPETNKTNRVSTNECEGGICAEEDDNMEPVADRKNTDTTKRKKKKRKHKSYRDKIRYNVGRDENDEFLPNDYEGIPAFGRHLQGVEYVYDVDIGPREIVPTDVKEIVSTDRNRRVGMVHKNSVEGDYGDEEDSMIKEKKENNKLVKKTDNEFADPVATTTEEDDDDEEYYEEAAENKKSDKGEDDTDEELASFGRRLHKQNKTPNKENEDKKVVKPKAKKVREAPSQRFLEKSEFQRWPQFVISDKVNEENLRKRSLAVKKTEPKRNIFPLSSKDYFTKSKSKRRDNPPLDNVFDKIMHANKSSTEKMLFDFDKPIKDNDMEVKLNLNLNMDDKNPKSGGLNDDITFFAVSTAVTTGNQTVSVTTEDEEECDSETPKVSVGNVCEENENFNKTKVALTTVLSIIPDTQGEISNETYTSDDFVKLDDILTGRLPFKILEYIRGHIKKDKSLRDRFLKGMKKGHGEEAFQNLPDVTNVESKKLINAMANLMNRLQITSTCQTLPGKLLRYLKSATRVRLEDALARAKEMEEVEFDDIQNQDTFIFQSNSRADNLEEKVRVLKDLLAKYNHLPDRCKPRAEPVREYVLNHLKLLTNMLSVAQLSPPRPKKTVQGPTEEDRTEAPISEPLEKKSTERDLVEQQLESLGLGKRHNFRPKFSLDDLIEHNRNAKEISVDQVRLRPGGNKKNKRELDTREQISEKYEKLRQAVKRERTKRDSERRVAENFGRLSVEDYNGEGMERDGTGSFESPLVFSF
ncbi:unnamed protein product [Phaedon cochleariae]|uniref:Uncharacterized protein n=1 Tax=Phaedon cochleariae TaxID=80249 RepID=A0A9P0GNP9_PHACE|nr:unnamed protein product [Phaedon cochleariae]